MAALGVSKDIRAQVQSHGLGGIQARHYDRHEYMFEKRAALEQLAMLAPISLTRDATVSLRSATRPPELNKGESWS